MANHHETILSTKKL